MLHRKKESKGDAPKLDMTPMIDVVFQLLIFFVVVLKQEDIFSSLSAARPTGEKTIRPEIPTTTIIVGTQGFVFNGRVMSLGELDRQLERVSAFSKTGGIVVKCTKDSPHGLLVQALDLCTKHGLTGVSLFSI